MGAKVEVSKGALRSLERQDVPDLHKERRRAIKRGILGLFDEISQGGLPVVLIIIGAIWTKSSPKKGERIEAMTERDITYLS